ncbi:uncharacterized protein LOC141726871 isoform X2 [Zonotrichia albicollis]|uniref:uncharacterized protein LOC141726871 isoform X2 n=1 Tax=Zonotrichia albicollis TaxID=44394 RepID=UPI003D80D7AC
MLRWSRLSPPLVSLWGVMSGLRCPWQACRPRHGRPLGPRSEMGGAPVSEAPPCRAGGATSRTRPAAASPGGPARSSAGFHAWVCELRNTASCACACVAGQRRSGVVSAASRGCADVARLFRHCPCRPRRRLRLRLRSRPQSQGQKTLATPCRARQRLPQRQSARLRCRSWSQATRQWRVPAHPRPAHRPPRQFCHCRGLCPPCLRQRLPWNRRQVQARTVPSRLPLQQQPRRLASPSGEEAWLTSWPWVQPVCLHSKSAFSAGWGVFGQLRPLGGCESLCRPSRIPAERSSKPVSGPKRTLRDGKEEHLQSMDFS